MKTKTRNLAKALAALALTTIIVACGGGSDPVATPSPVPAPGTPTTPTAPTCTPPAVLTNGSCVTPTVPGNPPTPPAPPTCTPPAVLTNGSCVTPPVTPPVTCTPPAVLTNGACVTPPTTPVITVPAPQPQNVKVYISAANTLPAGCNFTYEACWANSVNNGTVLIINGGGQNYAYYRSTTSPIGLVYVVRAIGSNGIPLYGSASVDDQGVSATQDWVMGTTNAYPNGIIMHQATDNTCWNIAYVQVTCPA